MPDSSVAAQHLRLELIQTFSFTVIVCGNYSAEKSLYCWRFSQRMSFIVREFIISVFAIITREWLIIFIFWSVKAKYFWKYSNVLRRRFLELRPLKFSEGKRKIFGLNAEKQFYNQAEKLKAADQYFCFLLIFTEMNKIKMQMYFYIH